MFYGNLFGRFGSRILDQYILISSTVLTLYDLLLILDDEVRRHDPTLLTSLLTRLSQRSGIFGEAARRGVSPTVRTERIDKADEQTAQQSPTFTSWCVIPDQFFRRIIDEARYVTDRTVSFSFYTSSGRFTTPVAQGIPRSV